MNFTNYEDVLAQLRSAGLVVEALEVGRRQRVRVEDDREKRGWYHLHEIPSTHGGLLLVGSYGIWRGTDNGATKIKLDARREPMTPDQAAALKARLAEDRRAAEAERKRAAARAAERARAMWSRLATEGAADYLQRKGVQAHGVRFSPSGAVVVPMQDAHGRLHGLQVIYPRGSAKAKRLGRDKDFWPAGVAKAGHFFIVGTPQAHGVMLVAEGYATAATLHEATGLPVAVAFDAGNMLPVAQALRARWKRMALVMCADDDYLGRCRVCREYTSTSAEACGHCGQPAEVSNAGVGAARAAALAVDGTWLAPVFDAPRPSDRKGPTDFNDLAQAEGLRVVQDQVETHLTASGLDRPKPQAVAPRTGGGGADRADLVSIGDAERLLERFALVYEAAETVFDAWEHKLVPMASVRNLCTSRELFRAWIESPDKRVVRLEEVGFDPTERDAQVKCNLWGGWPTVPKAGSCAKLLELGEYLCGQDEAGAEMWQWLLRWIAYPIQHPGAKMKTAVVMHGPQGSGKNMFFEAVLGVYGVYGTVVDQDSIEDKHNDFMSRKLFLVADEVLARQDMFHAKNKLKILVTSDFIRINPKFVASYRERNHVNMVFLSNEVMAMALERDDRRYGVIWTPQKWDASRYHAVMDEIRNGGIEALHHHLVHLDLGDFGPATLPPVTSAKRDLIELGMDSSERFLTELMRGDMAPIPAACTARTADLFAIYKHWCLINGVHKPAQMNTCVGSWSKVAGVGKARVWHYVNHSLTAETQSTVLHLPGAERPAGKRPMTDAINDFTSAAREWKDLQAKLQGAHEASRAGRAGADDGF